MDDKYELIVTCPMCHNEDQQDPIAYRDNYPFEQLMCRCATCGFRYTLEFEHEVYLHTIPHVPHVIQEN